MEAFLIVLNIEISCLYAIFCKRNTVLYFNRRSTKFIALVCFGRQFVIFDREYWR